MKTLLFQSKYFKWKLLFVVINLLVGINATSQELKYVGLDLPNTLIMPDRPISISFGLDLNDVDTIHVLDVKLSTYVNFSAVFPRSFSEYDLSFDGNFYRNMGVELSYNLNYSSRNYWNVIVGYHFNNLKYFRTICTDFDPSDQGTLFCEDWERKTVKRKSHTFVAGLGHTLFFNLDKVKVGIQTNFIASMHKNNVSKVRIDDLQDIPGSRFSEQDIPKYWTHLSYGIYALDQKLRFNIRPLLFVRYEI